MARTVSIDIVCIGAMAGTTDAATRPISAIIVAAVGRGDVTGASGMADCVCGVIIGSSVISQRIPASSKSRKLKSDIFFVALLIIDIFYSTIYHEQHKLKGVIS